MYLIFLHCYFPSGLAGHRLRLLQEVLLRVRKVQPVRPHLELSLHIPRQEDPFLLWLLEIVTLNCFPPICSCMGALRPVLAGPRPLRLRRRRLQLRSRGEAPEDGGGLGGAGPDAGGIGALPQGQA